MTQAQRAVQLDPFNPFYQGSYGMILFFARRYDEAVVQFQEVLRTSPPDSPFHCGLWHAFNITGRYEQALKAAEGCLGHYGREVKDALAQGYAEAGYPGAMRRVADLLATGLSGVYVAPIDVHIPYLHAGELDRALEWLSKSVEARDPNVYGATADPFTIDRLGDDPRFQELVRRVRLPSR